MQNAARRAPESAVPTVTLAAGTLPLTLPNALSYTLAMRRLPPL
jgi:hypothetical protein